MRTVFHWLAPLIVTSVASMSACSSTSNKPADDGTAVSAEPAELAVAEPSAKASGEAPVEASGDGQTLQFEGRIIHTPLPARKSVEAYLGVEFQLRIANRHVVLAASDSVSSEDLAAAADKEVKLTCTMRTAKAPSPHESYPMNADGTPMQRPDRCVVTALNF